MTREIMPNMEKVEKNVMKNIMERFHITRTHIS